MNQDVTVRDVLKGSLVSLSVSEALTDYCKDSSFDPEDPRCARLTLSGKMVGYLLQSYTSYRVRPISSLF